MGDGLMAECMCLVMVHTARGQSGTATCRGGHRCAEMALTAPASRSPIRRQACRAPTVDPPARSRSRRPAGDYAVTVEMQGSRLGHRQGAVGRSTRERGLIALRWGASRSGAGRGGGPVHQLHRASIGKRGFSGNRSGHLPLEGRSRASYRCRPGVTTCRRPIPGARWIHAYGSG